MNNSTKLLRTIYLIAGIIGFLTAVYLTVLKLTDNRQMCLQGVGDCWSVNISRYSEIMGVPISILGGTAYLVLIILYWLETNTGFWAENAVYAMFGMTLAGTLYSVYLTYIEIAVIKAICPFCVVSAIAMLVLFTVTTMRLFKSEV
jgi:uncharacterized membrane protein